MLPNSCDYAEVSFACKRRQVRYGWWSCRKANPLYIVVRESAVDSTATVIAIDPCEIMEA